MTTHTMTLYAPDHTTVIMTYTGMSTEFRDLIEATTPGFITLRDAGPARGSVVINTAHVGRITFAPEPEA